VKPSDSEAEWCIHHKRSPPQRAVHQERLYRQLNLKCCKKERFRQFVKNKPRVIRKCGGKSYFFLILYCSYRYNNFRVSGFCHVHSSVLTEKELSLLPTSKSQIKTHTIVLLLFLCLYKDPIDHLLQHHIELARVFHHDEMTASFHQRHLI
jgi:hypothetical protein